MSYEGDDTVHVSLEMNILSDILCELRKLNILLQDVHETIVTDEDIEDECN